MANFINELKSFQSIPRDLIFDNTLSDRARFVYCYMAAKPDGWEFFLEPMANDIGYSVETLRKYINELIKRGWLSKDGQGRGDRSTFAANTYTLHVNCRHGESPTPEITDTEIFRHGENPTRNIDNRDYKHNKDYINKKKKDNNKLLSSKEKENPDLSEAYTQVEEVKEKSEKENVLEPVTQPFMPKRRNDLKYPFESDEFLFWWDTLTQQPKWKKKTAHALQLSLNNLGKYDERFAIILMKESIEKNYQGVVYDSTDARYQRWKSTGHIETVAGPKSTVLQKAEQALGQYLEYLKKSEQK